MSTPNEMTTSNEGELESLEKNDELAVARGSGPTNPEGGGNGLAQAFSAAAPRSGPTNPEGGGNA